MFSSFRLVLVGLALTVLVAGVRTIVLLAVMISVGMSNSNSSMTLIFRLRGERVVGIWYCWQKYQAESSVALDICSLR
jgi:hypothetical protein